MMDPHVLACHCELAAEALDGVAIQATAAGRFLQRGDLAAAREAYNRVVTIFREFVAPEMKLIATIEADATLTGHAATEWRRDRPAALRPTLSAKVRSEGAEALA